MRLLYIHTGRAGEQKANIIQVAQMCAAFADAGADTILAINCYKKEAHNSFAVEQIRNLVGESKMRFRVQVFRGKTFLGRLRSLGCVGPIREICRNTPHDIVFLRDPILMPLVINQCGPFVFESHNRMAAWSGGGIGIWWRRRIVECAHRPEMMLFVAISQALANWWESHGVPAARIHAAHDGIDPGMFSGQLSQAEARKALGLPADQKIVVYAGSLYSDRSIPDILKLARLRKDVLFVIVGGPEFNRRRYENEAEIMNLGNVKFVGYVPFRNVPAYLSAADALLMLWSTSVPTIRCCSPLKVFEYMAAGRTIVGHRFPTIEEVLENGSDALLADPNCFDDLARMLDMALDRPDPQMAIRAREKVFSRYTWTQRCRGILNRLPPGFVSHLKERVV